MITSAELVRELHSATCPTCLGEKLKGAYFCDPCRKVLPTHMAASLFIPISNGLRNGLEKAYDEAKRCIRLRRATAGQMRAGRHTRA